VSDRKQKVCHPQIKDVTHLHLINFQIVNNFDFLGDLDIYEVLLNCISESGEGESISKTIAVASDILSPPSQIEAVATSLQTLNLSWVPSDSVDPLSLIFIITYNPVSNFSQNSTTVFTDM